MFCSTNLKCVASRNHIGALSYPLALPDRSFEMAQCKVCMFGDEKAYGVNNGCSTQT